MSTVMKRYMFVAVIFGLACTLCIVLAGCGGLGSGVTPKNSLEEYSWEELSAISNEISRSGNQANAIEVAKKYNLTNSSGKLDGTQTKAIQLSNGISTYVQIAGFYHDDKADGSGKAGITFIFGDVIAEHAMNTTDTSEGGWEASSLRSWLALDGMNMLPNDLKGLVVEVKKLTNNVGGYIGGNDIGFRGDTSVVTATTDKLWLFSFRELTNAISDDSEDLVEDEMFDESEVSQEDKILEAEGQQYQLFSDLGVSPYSSDNPVLCKPYQKAGLDYGDGDYAWWERTPYLGNYGEGTRFLNVMPDGNAFWYLSADNDRVGVVPGFCI